MTNFKIVVEEYGEVYIGKDELHAHRMFKQWKERVDGFHIYWGGRKLFLYADEKLKKSYEPFDFGIGSVI